MSINKTKKQLKLKKLLDLKYLDVYKLMYKYREELKEIEETRRQIRDLITGWAHDDKEGNELQDVLENHENLQDILSLYSADYNDNKRIIEYSYQIFLRLSENCGMYISNDNKEYFEKYFDDDFDEMLKNEKEIEVYKKRIYKTKNIRRSIMKLK